MKLYRKLRERIYKYLFRHIREHRKLRFANIPQHELSESHMANTTLLPDREELLRRLPQGGVVAELGVAGGDFSASILSLNKPSKLYLVDIWNSSSQRYGEQQRTQVLDRFTSEIERGSVEVLRELSTDAVDQFPDASLDWIYIDTSHTYDTTLEELRRYAPKLKPGGTIAGDDFTHLSKGSWTRFGVVDAVYQFCVQENWELVFLTMEIKANPSFALRRINARSLTPA